MSSCGQTPKVMLVTSSDSLASLACRKIFYTDAIKIVFVVKVKINFEKKIRILKAAIKSGALWYAAYMQAELLISKIYAMTKFGNFSINREVKVRSIPSFTATALDFENLGILIERYKPDIVLSVRPGLIFKKSLITFSPEIINLHCSALPAYAGIGGVIQALANEEKMLGISIHKIENEDIDSGIVVAQDFIQADSQKSVLWHTLKLYDKASETLLNYFESTTGPLKHKKTISPSYFSWPKYNVYIRLRSIGRGLFFPY